MVTHENKSCDNFTKKGSVGGNSNKEFPQELRPVGREIWNLKPVGREI